MKVFISQPMRNKTNDKIKEERKTAIETIKRLYPNEEIAIIDSFMANAPHDANPVWFLGKSIEFLSCADLAYFCSGWTEARGCLIEHEIAKQYGITVIEWECAI